MNETRARGEGGREAGRQERETTRGIDGCLFAALLMSSYREEENRGENDTFMEIDGGWVDG